MRREPRQQQRGRRRVDEHGRCRATRRAAHPQVIHPVMVGGAGRAAARARAQHERARCVAHEARQRHLVWVRVRVRIRVRVRTRIRVTTRIRVRTRRSPAAAPARRRRGSARCVRRAARAARRSSQPSAGARVARSRAVCAADRHGSARRARTPGSSGTRHMARTWMGLSGAVNTSVFDWLKGSTAPAPPLPQAAITLLWGPEVRGAYARGRLEPSAASSAAARTTRLAMPAHWPPKAPAGCGQPGYAASATSLPSSHTCAACSGRVRSASERPRLG